MKAKRSRHMKASRTEISAEVSFKPALFWCATRTLELEFFSSLLDTLKLSDALIHSINTQSKELAELFDLLLNFPIFFDSHVRPPRSLWKGGSIFARSLMLERSQLSWYYSCVAVHVRCHGYARAHARTQSRRDTSTRGFLWQISILSRCRSRRIEDQAPKLSVVHSWRRWLMSFLVTIVMK